jgi:hypothetical protein
VPHNAGSEAVIDRPHRATFPSFGMIRYRLPFAFLQYHHFDPEWHITIAQKV